MSHPPRNARALVPALALVLAAFAAGAAPALASFHLIRVNEVFSNSDGTLQYVELIAISDFQTFLSPTRVVAANADSSVANLVFDFVTSFPLLDNGETILLATAGFQAAAGFAPDFEIPDGRIFGTNGRVAFDQDFGPDVDAVAYGTYSGPNTGFGSPAAPLPDDGFRSLTRVASTGNNAVDFAVADNSPRRNDGTNGQLPNPNAVGPVEAVPVVLGLAAAPNPFALRTRILVGLSRGGPVALAVYDVEGRLVRELAQGELGAGSRAIEWDGRDRAGRPVAAGVYTLRLAAGDGTRSAKLTVLP
jgi:hypothetical protein